MNRRVLLGVMAAWGVGSRGVRAQTLGVLDALLLAPDGPALLLSRYLAAGGALERFRSRPGAWFALLFVPLWPRWPVELLLRPQRRGHALQVLALDAAPADAPSVAASVPLRTAGSEPAAQWSGRFMLPAQSAADGVYLLVELWRADFAAPPPLALRVRSVASRAGARAPWWGPADAARSEPPPSPLTLQMQQRDLGAFELPIWRLRVPAEAALPASPELLR